MNKAATKEQLQELMQYMSSKIFLPPMPSNGYAPIGTIISIMGTTAPQDYLVCDGTVYDIEDYEDLANYFATQYGSSNYFGGDGITTFAVPNLISPAFTGTITCIKCVLLSSNANILYDETGTEYKVAWYILANGTKKPVYEKTLSFTTASTVGVNNYGDFYGCTIVDISGGVINGADCFIPVNWYYDTNVYFCVLGNPSNTHNGIAVKTIRQYECNRPARITVRYTKTTD